MNQQNFLTVARAIEAEPDFYDQQHYTRCVAGWTWGLICGVGDIHRLCDISEDAAREALGLESHEADALFDGAADWTPAELVECAEAGVLPWERPGEDFRGLENVRHDGEHWVADNSDTAFGTLWFLVDYVASKRPDAH